MKLSAVSLVPGKALQLYYFKGPVAAGAEWSLSGQYPVSLLLHVSGHTATLSTGRKQSSVVDLTERTCIFSRNNTNQTRLAWKRSGEVAFFEIRITEAYLKKLLPDEHARKQLTDTGVNSNVFRQIEEMRNILTSLDETIGRSGYLKDILYQAKAMELLAVCLQHLLRPAKIPSLIERKHDLVNRAKKAIDSLKGKKTFTIISLAKELDSNETTLKSAFKEISGQTIFSYYLAKKLRGAKESLLLGNTVTHTATICGYSNVGHFSTAFKREFGITPSAYTLHIRKAI